jgi:hypothetical protein
LRRVPACALKIAESADADADADEDEDEDEDGYDDEDGARRNWTASGAAIRRTAVASAR